MTRNQTPIVVGVDGSAPSLAALRWAVEEGQVHGAPVWAVHVVDPRGRRRAFYAQSAGLDQDEVDRIQAAEAAELIGRNAPPSVRRVFEVGNPAAAPLHYADGARMLVLGHGEHRRRRDLEAFRHTPALGEVARACMSAALCPVTVIPAPIRLPDPRAAHETPRQEHDCTAAELEDPVHIHPQRYADTHSYH